MIRAGERWTLIQYQVVGPNRHVREVEALFASDPIYGDKIASEARAGLTHRPMPGSFRNFLFERPAGMPAFEPDRRLLNEALSKLGGPVEGEDGSAELAVRIELSAEGDITDWQDLFSTGPGLSAALRERVEVFLASAGLRTSGSPLAVILFFTIQDGRVVYAASSSYQLVCD